MKKLSTLFTVLAVILAIIMCAVVAYNYHILALGGQNAGYSAPPETAFVLAIPYLVGIAVCTALSVIIKKKLNK